MSENEERFAGFRFLTRLYWMKVVNAKTGREKTQDLRVKKFCEG